MGFKEWISSKDIDLNEKKNCQEIKIPKSGNWIFTSGNLDALPIAKGERRWMTIVDELEERN